MELKKVLLTGLASTFLLTACGSDDTEPAADEAEETTETESSEESEASAEEETEESTDEDTSDEEAAEEEVEEGDSPEQQVGDVIEEDGMTRTVVATNYGINETQESGPFTVTLLNAQISHLLIEDADTAEYFGGDDLALVSFEVEVSNNSEDTNMIYPDQGTIVTNAGDQVEADIFMSDSVGGDFLGEVTKTGGVYFTYEGDPEEITNVRYIVGSGSDENFDNFSEDLEFSIDF